MAAVAGIFTAAMGYDRAKCLDYITACTDEFRVGRSDFERESIEQDLSVIRGTVMAFCNTHVRDYDECTVRGGSGAKTASCMQKFFPQLKKSAGEMKKKCPKTSAKMLDEYLE
jgi:hypothetical protein